MPVTTARRPSGPAASTVESRVIRFRGSTFPHRTEPVDSTTPMADGLGAGIVSVTLPLPVLATVFGAVLDVAAAAGACGALGGILRCATQNCASREKAGAATEPPKIVPLGSSMVITIMIRGSSAGRKPAKDPMYLPGA